MSVGTRTGVDLTLFNASSATSAGLLTLRESNGEIAEEIVVLEARETRMLRDVVGTTFGRSGSRDGHLRLEPLRGELVASARLVTVSEEGTIGSTIPVHPRGAGLRLGQRRSIATVDDSRRKTIEESIPATWTTRFRLLETSGHEAVVRATIHVATGSMLAAARVSRDFEVGADQMLSLGQIGEAIMGEAREIGVDDLHDLLVDFVVVEGEGAVVVTTESIENGTGDVLIRFD